MPIERNRLASGMSELFAAGIEGTTAPLVVNPPHGTAPALVDAIRGTADPPRVRLLADAGQLKSETASFLTAASVADLVADGGLAVRKLGTVPANALVVSEDSVVALVEEPGPSGNGESGAGVAGLSTTDERYVRKTRASFDRRWEDAEPFPLQTPPLSRVRTTMREELGRRTSEDFDRVVDGLDSADGGTDEVDASLLAAARNDQLLYDVSRWGEEVGMASRATFSRTKTYLEEAGVLATENVPTDVGRPRLRLRLAAAFADTPPERLAEAAARQL